VIKGGVPEKGLTRKRWWEIWSKKKNTHKKTKLRKQLVNLMIIMSLSDDRNVCTSSNYIKQLIVKTLDEVKNKRMGKNIFKSSKITLFCDNNEKLGSKN
jgi:hypothetical protein